MIIDDLLQQEGLSRYRLSKISGVPQATISDICSGKAKLESCAAGTLYKIARALNVTVDSLLESEAEKKREDSDYRCSFETFKSNVCHRVKDLGDLDFIIEVLEKDSVRNLYKKAWFLEAMYLLGMVDYLSRINELPICSEYNDIRSRKLAETVYPSGVLLQAALMKDEKIKENARENAIPEFLRFNIVENEVRKIA